MVNNQQLDRTLGALADPIRRGILERLSRGEARVAELAKPFPVSSPAISKHLRVLESAGLIVRHRVGREHRIRANPAPLDRVQSWIERYAEAWDYQLSALETFLKTQAPKTQVEGGNRS